MLPVLVLVRPQDHFRLGILELVDAVALDPLELDRQNLRGLPLAVLAELDVADDGLEACGLRMKSASLASSVLLAPFTAWSTTCIRA